MAEKDIQQPSAGDSTLDVKELAVHEHRNWVRTTYSCNNRCIFCLDGDVPRKGHRPDEEVFKEIKEGFRENSRLIVSGGDASIHPSFVKFIAYGKELGYNWIQTISNGRMFAYKELVTKAADAGLNEITFSMHGHNSELHDTLTGIKGGFAQALRGMINVLKDGRIVVNVDCVINGINYKYLDDILKFYMKLGIHEFDLLQIVPFGRAWWDGNRERLFYNVEEAFPYLNKAFKHAFKPGNYIWTNRFPVAFLEGVEGLIQDPHKLFDEVNGRRSEYQQFVENGEKLQCYPERCDYCFLQEFCGTLYDLKDSLDQHTYQHLEIFAENENSLPSKETMACLTGGGTLESVLLHAENIRSAMKLFKLYDLSKLEIHLRLDDWADFETTIESPDYKALKTSLRKLVCEDKDQFEKLIAGDYPIELLVTSETAPLLIALKDKLAACKLVSLRLPSYETLTEATDFIIEPDVFFAEFENSGIKAYGVPKCIYQNAEPEVLTIRATSLAEDGKISMTGYTRDYICHSYMAKSNRCKDCSEKENCQGLHINTIRVHGFKQLKPM